MLLKCIYKGVSLWSDDFSKSVAVLEPEDVVLSLGAEITPHLSSSYLRVFYKGHIGWVPHISLKLVED